MTRPALGLIGHVTFREPKCISCGETRREMFYRHPSSKTGVQSRCKRCDNRVRQHGIRGAKTAPPAQRCEICGAVGFATRSHKWHAKVLAPAGDAVAHWVECPTCGGRGAVPSGSEGSNG